MKQIAKSLLAFLDAPIVSPKSRVMFSYEKIQSTFSRHNEMAFWINDIICMAFVLAYFSRIFKHLQPELMSESWFLLIFEEMLRCWALLGHLLCCAQFEALLYFYCVYERPVKFNQIKSISTFTILLYCCLFYSGITPSLVYFSNENISKSILYILLK